MSPCKHPFWAWSTVLLPRPNSTILILKPLSSPLLSLTSPLRLVRLLRKIDIDKIINKLSQKKRRINFVL